MPKNTNDGFDLSEFDDLLSRESEPDPLEFDIFNLSLDDVKAAPKSGGQDDLDLDSFLKFYDEPFAPAEEPAREEAPAEEPAPEEPAAEEPAAEETPAEEPQPEKKRRRSRKARAEEITAPEAAEEVPAEEAAEQSLPEELSAPAAGEEIPVPAEELAEKDDFEDDEDEKPRFSLKHIFRRCEAEEAEEETEELVDGEEDAEDEEQPRFSLRRLFHRDEEPEDDEEELSDEEAEDEDDRPRFSLAALFRRKEEAPEDVDDEPVEEAGEDEAAADEADEAPGTKISFFSRLSPEREKFLSALHAKGKKAGEAEEDQTQPVVEEKALQKAAPAAVGLSLRQSLPRQPKGGELLVYDSELDEIDYIDDEDLPEIRDYMPIRFSRHSRSGIGGGLMYALFIISISIILACAGWLFASDVLALNKPDTTSIVTIHPYVPTAEDTLNEDGDAVDEDGRVITVNIDQVASALKSGGVIEYKWLFKLFSELASADVKIDPGTYDVSAKLDYRALVTEMQTGSDSQEITRITFPEGYTMEQIFTLLEDNGICDKDELYDVAANYDFSYDWLDGLELGDPNRLEGYLFPDTYDFYQGESAVNAIDRFLNRFHYILTLDMYKQAENLGITMHEAVIIASLIEEEAGPEDNRSYFASVIFNRLHDGWKLQLDSTLNYIKGTSTFDLTYDDMEIDSPYNTYMYEGLPPGPISNPGKASLEAALNPASTNYWFWYAYEGKTTFFSSSGAFNEFVAAHPIS